VRLAEKGLETLFPGPSLMFRRIDDSSSTGFKNLGGRDGLL